MAAVLAQVRGNTVGARLDRDQRGAHRIGIAPASRVAKGCDVIDVDSKTQRRTGHSELAGFRFRLPHPRMNAFAFTRQERRLRRVSKDKQGIVASWLKTAQERLLTMRR